MKLLLDTHTLLWFVLGDPQLSSTARALILDPANTKLVSPASYWEIAIKVRTAKYKLNAPYDVFMQRGILGNGFPHPAGRVETHGGADNLATSSPRPLRALADCSGDGRRDSSGQR
jgi:hypothetical protein